MSVIYKSSQSNRKDRGKLSTSQRYFEHKISHIIILYVVGKKYIQVKMNIYNEKPINFRVLYRTRSERKLNYRPVRTHLRVSPHTSGGLITTRLCGTAIVRVRDGGAEIGIVSVRTSGGRGSGIRTECDRWAVAGRHC